MLKIQSVIQKVLFTAFLSITAVSAFSQNTNDGNNIYLYTKATGEATVYSLDEIDKIKFTKNGVEIWNTKWPTEYAYSNVRVLTFNGNVSVSSVGDANDDGVVNAADIVEVLNYLSGKKSGKFNAVNADANNDGKVNKADVDKIVKLIMAK